MTFRVLLRSPAATALAALLLGACSALPGHAEHPAHRVRGPLADRPQQPLARTFLGFRPRRAVPEPEGTSAFSVHSAYSSVFENASTATERVALDGEYWRTGFAWRHGLGPSTDVELELPVVFATSGFLDRFVEEFHDAFGLPDSGRDERGTFDYEMSVAKGGQEIWSMEGDRLGLGDLSLAVTQALVDENAHRPALALRLGVELPTGSESDGFGNGAFDWGLGLLAEKSAGRWTLTGAVDVVDAARPSAFVGSGVDVSDLLGAQLGVEYRWSDATSLLAELQYASSLTDDIDLEEVAGEMLTLGVGVAFDVGQASRLTLAFEEDVLARTGADFTVFVSWTLAGAALF